MKKNIAWFSIVIAMWIVLLITLLAFLILEYIIPFGRNVKGIENASKAYYQAQSGIEQALSELSKESNFWEDLSKDFTTSPVSHQYIVIGSGSTLPKEWEWNSEYDNRWNIIAPWKPIQLAIGKLNTALDWSNTEFFFRVPDLNNDNNSNSLTIEQLEWVPTTVTWADEDGPIINWQLSSFNDLLTATWSWIQASDIDGDPIIFNGKEWILLEDGEKNIESFYNDECTWTASWCTLKLSIVNPLEIDHSNNTYPQWTLVPYLEWKIVFSNAVPLRYANVEGNGKSYGFQKKLEVKIPQQTIVEAFDFTVFQ